MKTALIDFAGRYLLPPRGPVLVEITDLIRDQVRLLDGPCALSDLETVQARLEAIRHFACQGLFYIEERAGAIPLPADASRSPVQ